MTQILTSTAVPAGRPARGYIPALDGVRALGVLLVIVCHFDTWFFLGDALGVDIFFVLSGFLITGILLREQSKTGGIRLKRFYLRRFTRLYPALFVVVVLTAIPGLMLAPMQKYFVADMAFALTYTAVIPFGITHWNALKMWGPAWTLSLEELYYLIWPALLLVGVRIGWIRRHLGGIALIVGVAALSVAASMSVAGLDASIFLRMGGLLVGAGAAIILHRRPDVVVRGYVGSLGLVILLTAVVAATFHEVVPFGAAVLAVVIGSVMLTAHLATSSAGWIVKLFAFGPVVALGLMSYEWYLWHFPVRVLLSWATGAPILSLAWVWVPVSFLLAWGTHILLAPYIDRLKARIS